jgi:ABC-type branched-subunit amino acid transport system substrate-binding protein
MNKHIKTWIVGFIVLLVIFGIAFISKKSQTPIDENSIKIGAVVSLSGAAVQDGESIKEGIDMAVNDAKKLGKNVEIIYSDDASDPKKTATGVHYVAAQGAQAVVGFTWDFLYDAASSILNQKKIVGISPTNTSEYTASVPGGYGFFTSPKTSTSRLVLEDFLREKKIKSIAFVATKFAWSDVHLANLKKAAKNTGVVITSENWASFGGEKEVYNTVLPKIKKENPDAVFMIAGGDESVSHFFVKLQQVGLKVPTIAGTTTVGRYLANNPGSVSVEYPIYALAPITSPEFLNYYKKIHKGKTPGEYVEAAYDSVHMLVNILSDKDFDGDVKSALEKNSEKNGGYVNRYLFDKKHDNTGSAWQLRKDN